MAFKMPKLAAGYFRLIDDNTSGKTKLIMFDQYYFCLMVGFNSRRIATDDKIKSDHFIDYYPNPYSDKVDLIAGLLIDAEMERRAIEPENRDSVQGLILELIDHHSLTRLSGTGIGFLNQYAAHGMDIIVDNIPKTRELEIFLVQYFKLLNPEVA